MTTTHKTIKVKINRTIPALLLGPVVSYLTVLRLFFDIFSKSPIVILE
jgi:hypothetical protein